MPETEVEVDYSLQNVVLKGDIGRRIDLSEVSESFECIEYNPDRFPAGVFGGDSAGTVLLFESGSVTCTGAKSVSDGKAVVNDLYELVRRDFAMTSPSEPTVVNKVATSDLEAPIDLKVASVELGLERVEFEPDQFPGLVYRPDLDIDQESTCLIFASGKLVLTGNTRAEHIERTIRAVREDLEVTSRISS